MTVLGSRATTVALRGSPVNSAMAPKIVLKHLTDLVPVHKRLGVPIDDHKHMIGGVP